MAVLGRRLAVVIAAVAVVAVVAVVTVVAVVVEVVVVVDDSDSGSVEYVLV